MSSSSNESSTGGGWWSSFKSVFTFNRDKPTVKTILLGLDAAGKTTMLYRLKKSHDEVVTTIPTIGFNVETVAINKVNFTCWDVGGCDKIRPLWRHFLNDLSMLMFMYDSNDHERGESAWDELRMFLRMPEVADRSFIKDSKTGRVKPVGVLIFANKQDLRNAKSCQEILLNALKMDSEEIRKGLHPWHIVPTCMVDPNPDPQYSNYYVSRPDTVHYSKCNEVIDLFVNEKYEELIEKFGGISHLNCESVMASWKATNTAKNVFSGTASGTTANTSTTTATSAVDQELIEHEKAKRKAIWQDWLSRASLLPSQNGIDVIDSDDHFIHALENCTLSTWDHLTHVRIAWIYLQKFGLEEGYQAVDKSIDHYIQHSDRTNGKSFHPTMTRFWCHMIAYWLIHWLQSKAISASSSSSNGVVLRAFPGSNDHHLFYYFLCYVYEHRDFMLTDIANGALFKVYYSNGLIFSPSAKSAVVQPDLKDLPNFESSLTSLIVLSQPSDSSTSEKDSLSADASVGDNIKKDSLFLTNHDYWKVNA